MNRFSMTPTRTYTLTLIAVTAVSLAGNVRHAMLTHNHVTGETFTVAWFAVPPLLLPLAVHVAGLLARRPQSTLAGADWWYRLTHGWVHRVTVLGVAAVATGTFAVSFVALRELTSAMGAPALVATIFPVTLDLLAGLATVALLTEQRDDALVRTADATASVDAHQGDALAPGGAQLPADTTPSLETDVGDGAPAPVVHHAPTCGDTPTDAPDDTRASQALRHADAPGAGDDELTRTTDFDVVRPDAPGVHQGDVPDPLLGLAHQLVEAGRTTASPDVVYMVLVRTTAGMSSRAVAEEVGEVSYSAVQRISKAAREVASGEGGHPALTLVG